MYSWFQCIQAVVNCFSASNSTYVFFVDCCIRVFHSICDCYIRITVCSIRASQIWLWNCVVCRFFSFITLLNASTIHIHTVPIILEVIIVTPGFFRFSVATICDQILENHPYGRKWHIKYLALKSSIQHWISTHLWLQ